MNLQTVLSERSRRRRQAADTRHDSVNIDKSNENDTDGPNLGGLSESEINVNGLIEQSVKSASESNHPAVFPHHHLTAEDIYGPRIVCLHQDMENFYKNILPRPEEQRLREFAVQETRDVVNALWPTAKVEIFGSFKTGLYLPTSDIDLLIDYEWTLPPYDILKGRLLETETCSEVKVIASAKVPVIKLVHKRTHLKMDVIFKIHNVQDSAKLIESYSNMFPTLPCLVMVLKQFLQQKNLNEVYTGGLSSYSLCLMLISFLKTHPRNEGRSKTANCGALLVEFFYFYGISFDYSTTTVNLMEGGYTKRSLAVLHSDQLTIQDPFSPDNDVARGSYNYAQVRISFQCAFHSLYFNLCAQQCHRGDSHNLLSSIVHNIPECYRIRRRSSVEKISGENHRIEKQVSTTSRNSSSSSPLDAYAKSALVRKLESPRGSPDEQVNIRSNIEGVTHYSTESSKSVVPDVVEISSSLSKCSVSSVAQKSFVFPTIDHSSSLLRSTSPHAANSIMVQTFPLRSNNPIPLSEAVERCLRSVPPPPLPLDRSMSAPILDRSSNGRQPLMIPIYGSSVIQAAPTSNLFERPPPPIPASGLYDRPPPPVPASNLFDRPPPPVVVPLTPTTPTIPLTIDASNSRSSYSFSESPTGLSRQLSAVLATNSPVIQTHHALGTTSVDMPMIQCQSSPIWKNNSMRSGTRRSSASTWIIGYDLGPRGGVHHPPRRGYAEDRNERRVAALNS